MYYTVHFGTAKLNSSLWLKNFHNHMPEYLLVTATPTRVDTRYTQRLLSLVLMKRRPVISETFERWTRRALYPTTSALWCCLTNQDVDWSNCLVFLFGEWWVNNANYFLQMLACPLNTECHKEGWALAVSFFEYLTSITKHHHRAHRRVRAVCQNSDGQFLITWRRRCQ